MLYPEIIKNVGFRSVRLDRFVVGADLVGHVVPDVAECLEDGFAIMECQGVAGEEVRDGIDIASDSARAKLCCLADCRAAAHERIEYGQVFHARGTIERAQDVGAGRCQRAERNRAKDCSETLRPPFVNVVNRAVYFFAPALDLGNIADGLEGKIVILQCAWPGERNENVRLFDSLPKIEPPICSVCFDPHDHRSGSAPSAHYVNCSLRTISRTARQAAQP